MGTSGDLPHFWIELAITKKQHNITLTHRALDETVATLRVCVPTLALPTLLYMVILLTVRLEDKDYLSRSLHHFVLGQHTLAVNKSLHAHGDHYNLISEGKGNTGAYTVKMSVSDSVACSQPSARTGEAWN